MVEDKKVFHKVAARASMLTERGRHEDALTYLREYAFYVDEHNTNRGSIQGDRDAIQAKAECFQVLGNALAQAGQAEEALQAYHIAFELDGTNTKALIAYGSICRGHSKHISKAVERHWQAFKASPENADCKCALACTLNDVGTFVKHAGTDIELSFQLAIEIFEKDVFPSLGIETQPASTYEKFYEAAVCVDGNYAPAWYNQGVVQEEKGNLDKARRFYSKAIDLHPGYTEALCNLGAILKNQKDYEGSVCKFEQSLKTKPNHPKIKSNLAQALCEWATQLKNDHANPKDIDKMHWLQKAIKLYERAMALEPKHPLVTYNLGVAYAESGDHVRAIAMYELTVAFAPECAEAWNNLGLLLNETGNTEGAIEYYLKASQLNPQFAQPLNNLGIIYASQGAVQKALDVFNASIQVNPKYAEVYNNLGVLYRDMGAMSESIEAYEACLVIDEHNRSASHNLLMGLNYIHGGEEKIVSEEHSKWGQKVGEQYSALLPEFTYDLSDHTSTLSLDDMYSEMRKKNTIGVSNSFNSSERYCTVRVDPDKEITIGYVSADLFTHSVSYFAEAPLVHHKNVRVIVYNVTATPDAKTQRLKDSSAKWVVWRDVVTLSDVELAKLIRQDRVDILVELSGHTAHNRLIAMAMKPAPIQATWIGYPNSTGLKQVDYRLTDIITDPIESDQSYVEKLERLPGCFLCYTPSPDAPKVSALPVLSTEVFTFGTFNALAKVTQEVVVLWASILKAVPGSRLLIKAKAFFCESGRKRVLSLFEAENIGKDRLDLVPLIQGHSGHLSLYSHVDVALDPFPYAGTTTTCEALYMGVPTITLKGKCHAQNVGVTLLDAVGIASGFVAETKEEYLSLAVHHATHTSELSKLRGKLREKMLQSPLCDAETFVSGLESVYRKWWRNYCIESTIESGEGNLSECSADSSMHKEFH